jgi:hypothetical protein
VSPLLVYSFKIIFALIKKYHMVTIEKNNGNFIFTIKGIHKLWALKSELTIPAEHIMDAYPNTNNLHVSLGLRMPGTSVPGLIEAGTFIGRDGVIFCDITNGSKSIVIDLQNDHYDKMIIDVEDPDNAIALLSQK